MARQRRQKDVSSTDIPLAHPDKSGPDPSRQTLLNLAAERGLLDPSTQNRKAGKLPAGSVPLRDEQPIIGRFGEAVLWSSSLAMLHFTLDVLTQHQYAEVLSWPRVITQSLQAFGGMFLSSCFKLLMVLIYSSHTCILLCVAPTLGSGGLLSLHPTAPSPGSLLRKQCWGWLLSDPHHQRIQLLRGVKASSAVRRDMDMVSHRA